MIRFVLAGNQNSGKTTLFNALTGENRHVGNWPGVTVERRSGSLRGRADAEVTDLPGTYSLVPYTLEERVTRDVLLEGTYNAVINVVDATCLQRGLYLTLQLKALGVPVVVALNMMDDVRRRGDRIDIPALAALLDAPVVPVAARSGEGVADLTDAAMAHAAQSPVQPSALPVPTPELIDARYAQIADLLARTCRFAPPGRTLTERVDGVLLQTRAGLPLMIAALSAILFLTFGPVGAALSAAADGLIAAILSFLTNALDRLGASTVLTDFITQGLLAGVGSVLSFLPTLLLMLLLLSLLEDSGFMARAAFLMDRPLRRIGLNGRAFIPMLLGLGCTVPAAMAARTMTSRRDRTFTVLLLPFLSCSAKLPVYALLTQRFFGRNAYLVILALYAGGMTMGVAMAHLMKETRFAGAPSPLLMELPVLRMPGGRSVLRGIRDRAGEFLLRVFSIIMLATAAVWLLRSFTPDLRWTDNPTESLLGKTASLIVPFLTPLGFGSPEAAAALMTGLLAKESIVSTLTILVGDGGLQAVFPSSAAVLSFLTFALLYTPCTAALTAMSDALGSRRATAKSALVQLLTAWLAAWAVFRLASLVI
ncbi:MAG: ferrous iron transporter B [Aristaeellaceae bacterium]